MYTSRKEWPVDLGLWSPDTRRLHKGQAAEKPPMEVPNAACILKLQVQPLLCCTL